MAERKVDLSTDELNSIRKYIKEVQKHYDIDSVILFGSYAKGAHSEESDIDLAVISKDIKNEFEDGIQLLKLTWGIDTRIEPHAFSKDGFENNPFSQEIIRTGVELYVA